MFFVVSHIFILRSYIYSQKESSQTILSFCLLYQKVVISKITSSGSCKYVGMSRNILILSWENIVVLGIDITASDIGVSL